MAGCPRCDDVETEKVADSPVTGVFEVYRCRHCNYVWRSTEDLMGIRKYDPELVERARRRPLWDLR